jgi:nucleoside-diphosphate-sugar epimerase
LARALIVGCGCRGRELGARLTESGWQVRGTSRAEAGVRRIAEAGLDGALADPDGPGTVLDLVADVSVVVWLLGSAAGEDESVAAIHGTRLQSLLERLVDTPVRGFAYEAAGSGGAGGAQIVRAAAETWRIPVAILDGHREAPGWAKRTAEEIAGVLGR